MDADFHALILSDRRRCRKGVFKDCTEDNHLRAGQPPIDPQRATQRVSGLSESKGTDQPTGPSPRAARPNRSASRFANKSRRRRRAGRGDTYSHVGEIWRPVCQEPVQTRHKTRVIHIDFEQFEKTFTGQIECALRRKRRQRWRRWRWLP